MIGIKGLNKGAVLAALYNNTKIAPAHHRAIDEGLERDAGPMTAEEAGSLEQRSFDYLNGRVLKVDLTGDEFEEGFYDRVNGQGKAARVIDNLRRTGSVEKII
jgi:hypothetical protein